MIYILALALCIAADQALKLWVVANLGLYESMPLLPGIVEMYYIQNTGGGFSILTGHTWLLAALTVVLMAILGALIGYGMGTVNGALLGISLSFAAGAMLYVILGELLPESEQLWRHRLSGFATLAGLLLGLALISGGHIHMH